MMKKEATEECAARRGCWDTARGLEVSHNYFTTTPPTRVEAYTSPSRLCEVRGFVWYSDLCLCF